MRLDRYTLVLPLGEGGQAVVWKVIDPLEGGAVRALKVFHLAGSNPHVAERARREAKASAGLQHPGLLPCRTYLEDPAAEIAALVFDYVRGRSLADALTEPRMTPEHRRCAVRQIAETLAHVHERGVIHRDVKPDNVLVTDAFWDSPGEPGTLKLVDFGIAAPAGNPNPLTREGGVVGTAPYLPPELLDTQGLFGAGTDFQRDVFAFGVLAWEVLVGKHPTGLALDASRDAFAGIYLSARAGKRPWPPEAGLSTELRVAASCLALSPTDRPESGVAISKAFRAGETGILFASTAQTLEQRTSNPLSPTRETPADSLRPLTEPWRSSGSVPTPPARGDEDPGTSIESRSKSPARTRPPRAFAVAKWAALLAATAAIAVFNVAGFRYLRERGSPTDPPGSAPAAPIQSAPGPNPRPAPEPSRAPQQPIPHSPKICCDEASSSCRSGRDCQPQPCKSEPLGEGPWRLRVAGGFLLSGATKTEIQRAWPSSLICLKNTRTGEEACASSKAVWTRGSDPKSRITARTSDLLRGDIEIRVENNGWVLARDRGFSYPNGYSTGALCSNITLHLHEWQDHQGMIYIFLDDP